MKRAARLFASSALALLVACSSDTKDLDGDGGGTDSGVPIVMSKCMSDDDCPTDQHCDDTTKLCVAGTGNDCTDDTMCAAGERCEIVTNCGATRCHGNTCVPKDCQDHDDCGPGSLCVGDKCSPAPACGNGCPQGTVCDPITNLCAPEPGPDCTQDNDCPDPTHVCINDECVAPMPCTTTSSCTGGLVCRDGVCREPCMADEDCGSRFRWSCMANGECQLRCFGDGQCNDGQICENLLCEPQECTMNSDCDLTNDEECVGLDQGHGRCVSVPRCGPMNPCDPNFFCDNGGRCRELPRCTGDRDCDDDEFCDSGHCQPAMGCMAASCPAGEHCIGDRCVPGGCRGLSDCTAPQICIGGACQMPPPPTFITEVRIITPAGVVRPGTSYRFVAIALSQSGAVVPGVVFEWTSTSTLVASIDADGLATGGARAGETQIIARTNTGAMTISSVSVPLINLGPVPIDDVRVSVRDRPSGTPLNGATVRVQSGTFTATATTDARGIAIVTNVPQGAARSITVGAATHDWVSLLGVTGNDFLVPLPTLSTPSRAGGLTGNVDLSQVTSSGALAYSISGGSFQSPLTGFDAGALFGSNVFDVDVSIPGAGSFQIPIGASATLSIDAFGMAFNLKDTYYTETSQGLRAAWCFGGRLDASIFTGGGGGGPGDILGATLPYFQRFQHAVRPSVPVVSVPKVPDITDVDNDGDTTELVPDYANFPDVALTPTAQQSLRYYLRTDGARLPFVEGGNANTLIVITGTLLPGIGFVPLGLDGLQDSGGNGLVQSFTTRLTPPHSGLEIGEFAVMATAFRASMGALPQPGSTRLVVAPQLPLTVDLTAGWIDAPVNTTYTTASRSLNVPPVMGVDVVNVRFETNDGAWEIYTVPSATPVAVPASPLAAMDRTSSATITAIAIDLATGSSLSTLFDAASGGTSSTDHAMQGFSKARVTHQ